MVEIFPTFDHFHQFEYLSLQKLNYMSTEEIEKYEWKQMEKSYISKYIGVNISVGCWKLMEAAGWISKPRESWNLSLEP